MIEVKSMALEDLKATGNIYQNKDLLEEKINE